MQAFTIKADPPNILNVLSSPIDVIIPNTKKGVQVSFIWDTGATGSAITTKVVKALGLIPTGVRTVSTAGGLTQQNTYTVSLRLTNGIQVNGVTVTEVDALTGGQEGLIGMDIITLGDFAITNHNGCTHMSFRIPSSHVIDYVTSPEFGVVVVTQEKYKFQRKTGQNDPCPCGSGKKYKRCHGQH